MGGRHARTTILRKKENGQKGGMGGRHHTGILNNSRSDLHARAILFPPLVSHCQSQRVAQPPMPDVAYGTPVADTGPVPLGTPVYPPPPVSPAAAAPAVNQCAASQLSDHTERTMHSRERF